MSRIAKTSLIFLVLISLMAIFAPWITRYSFEVQNISDRLQGPSIQHWMGTDSLGRDLYSRVVYGARMSLAIGVITAFFAMILGTFVGAVSGYLGGLVDSALMRMVDIFYIFPATLMAILLTVLFGRGVTGIFVALSMSAWISQARLIRGQVLQARELAYVESAKALGARNSRILFRHILPNILAPTLVSLTIQIPTNIMSESFLSFIGLGLQPPYSSWGTLAQEGFRALQSFPHLIIFPGTILFITLLAFHFLGEAIEKKATKRE